MVTKEHFITINISSGAIERQGQGLKGQLVPCSPLLAPPLSQT